MFKLKRAYEKAERVDGVRVLVDRLWPRGVSKARAKLNYWAKGIAPSTELREWFDHDPKRWSEFKKRYKAELRKNKPAFADLRAHLKGRTVTLVYSAKDEVHNDAVVLKEVLEK